MKRKVGELALFSFTGMFFLYFSNGVTSFAAATWMYSIFFLQISRKERHIYSYLLIPLFFGITCQLSYWNFLSNDASNPIFFLPFILGLLIGLLYYLDKLIYSKTSGFKRTIGFPLIYTSFEFVFNLFSPIGAGMIGYSQHEFLSFSQLASITGMWGLTFMIIWFGSTIQWAFNNLDKKGIVIKGLLIYFSVFFLAIIYGGIRLNMPLRPGVVTVAGIHSHDKDAKGIKIWNSIQQDDSISFNSMSNEIFDDLIAITKNQSRAGAQIVLWSEISYYAMKNQEQEINDKLIQLAKDENIYLITNPFIFNPNSKSENKIKLYTPDGEMALEHFKYGGNFMEGTVLGNKIIQTIKTSYGNISGLICWDADFPSIVRQAGKSKTDILFIPASDWKEITPFHAVAAVYRGIENGCSIVRQTRNGLSIMTDPRGKIITQMNHFKTDSWVMNGQVPNKRMWSLYPHIGDLFGWLSLIGLIFFIIPIRYKI